MAGLGSDTIKGVGNNPPYNYSVGTISDPANANAILSQAGMDGKEGGWAVLYGGNPIRLVELAWQSMKIWTWIQSAGTRQSKWDT